MISALQALFPLNLLCCQRLRLFAFRVYPFGLNRRYQPYFFIPGAFLNSLFAEGSVDFIQLPMPSTSREEVSLLVPFPYATSLYLF